MLTLVSLAHLITALKQTEGQTIIAVVTSATKAVPSSDVVRSIPEKNLRKAFQCA